MKTKKIAIAMLSLLMLSGIVMTAVKADPWPNLPTSTVTLEITNNTPWEFPFIIALSNVPGGYDVSNGEYTGWCVDVTHFIERGVEYQVTLYSSLNPPSEVSSVEWDMANYILNHKDAGTGADIQDALWYFINGGAWYTWGVPHTHTATAEAIVADAIANGAGYAPGAGDTLAIICLPEEGEACERAQMLVIELTVPTLEPGYTPGFWKHNIGVCLGENPGRFSCFADGTRLSCSLLQGYLTYIKANYPAYSTYTLDDAYADLTARGPGANTVRDDMANAFNAAAGYGPFND